MASKVRQFKITFKNIKEGEISCSNPIVKLFNFSENVVQKCEFNTEDNSAYISVYEDALEGLEGKCIQFSVLCENCGKCPQKDGKICFCNNYTDCEECQDCINGICVNRCPDMLCVDDKCVNCEDNDDCPNNQVCIGGKCTCPPTQPYFNEETGKCYGCNNDNECGPCYRCIDGNCVKLDCICDEDLDQCVECVKASDCGPNMYCVNNKCECLPGYIWDEILQECVVAPDCTEDTDCDECEICVNGECQPIVCPDPNQICIGGQCVDIPCDGPCDDATDCGPDCGCLNGECVKCEDLDCVTCAQTIGCKCTNGECEKDNSPCAQYSCETNCGDRPDCGCQEDGSCEEVECSGESTLAKNEDECKLEYNLETTKCCECSKITLDNKLMSATIVGTLLRLKSKVEVRKGEVTTPLGILSIHRVDENQYDDIMDNEEATQGQVQISAKYTYRNVSNNLETIETVNLTPIFDIAGVGYMELNVDLNKPGNEYPIGVRVLKSVELTYTLISELTFESGCTYDEDVVIGYYTFTDADIASSITAINTKTSGQDSNVSYWIAKTLEDDACRVPEAKWYKAPANTDGSIGTFETVPFRKAYLTKLTNTTFTDFIDEPDENDGPTDNNGELFSGYYYKVATDCACINEATAYYESTCENPGRVVFCDPQTADIEFDECGKKITFNAPFVTDCLPNYDYYGDNEDFVPDGAKLRYSIHVNGSDTPLSGSVKIADEDGLIYNTGQVFTATELIEYIEIKFSHDNCDECTIRIESDVDKELPNYSVICAPSGASNTTYTITFTNWTGITSVTVSGNTATAGSPTVNITVANTVTSLTGLVQFTDCSGTVPMNIQLPENCCDDLTVTLSQNTNDCDGSTYDFVASSSPSVPGTYTFSVNGTFSESNEDGLFSTPKNIGGNEPNTISVSFNPTAEGCDTVVTSIEVDKTNTITINSNKGEDIATCGNADVFITYPTTGYTGSVTYTVTGDGTTTATLDGSEDLVIEVNGEPDDTKFVTITDVTLEDESGNTCIALYPGITNLQWIDEPEVTSVDVDVTDVCEGEAITFTVLGTEGATATVNVTNVLGTAPTSVIVGNPYVVYAGAYTNDVTITATLVTVGECSEVINVGAAVNVLDAPEIENVDQACETPGSPSSNILITVTGTSGATVVAAADEGNVSLTESPSGTYTGLIDASNGGDSITITMTLAGCSDDEVVSITGCACDEEAFVEIELDGDVITEDDDCVGETHSYTTNVSGGNSPFGYEWRLDNATSGTLLGTSSTLDFEFPIGSHTLYVVVTDDEGCEFQTSIDVVGHAIPTATINGDSTPCDDGATVYSVSYTNGPISSYQWQLDAVNTVTTSTYSYTPADNDPHTISVVITNNNGCVSEEATLVVTAEDCCVICDESSAPVRDAVTFNRLKDTNNNVYTISPAISFECVDPGDPSVANDAAAAALEAVLDAIPAQCGTPTVSWVSSNSGDETECLSETFNVTSGTSGVWFRGIHVNGVDHLTNTKIFNATAGSITGYTTSQASAENTIEGFINFALGEEGVGALSINVLLPSSPSGATAEVKIEIIGIAGETVKFLYHGTSGGGPTAVDVDDAACIALSGTFYEGRCILVTVEDSSIVPALLYNNLDSDLANQGAFGGDCNPV